MFKKTVEAKSQQRLSGADRKKLRRTIRERFPNASDADIDTLLPPKAEFTVSKYPNRILVYGLEGDCPLFFDIDGRGNEIFPTVYALWKVPGLLPAFVLKGGEVSRFVIGGADLMFPGIYVPAEGLPLFSAGEAWAVLVPGNPAPIAVGTTTMSSTEALKAGLRGKALRINHYYRDTLWEATENPYVPNAGFYEDVVFEDPAFISTYEASGSHEGDDSVEKVNSIDNEGAADAVEVEATSSSSGHAPKIQSDVTNEETEQLADDMVGLKVIENVSADELKSDDQHPLSAADIDVLLDKCLLQALHTTVKEKDLPMPGSTLWSSHVLPCRPSGITLDIKKSSYKKLSKWLQAKASAGWITVKEDKHKKEANLFSVNRKHPDYMCFTPEKKKPEKTGKSINDGSNEEQSSKLLEVAEIYKPTVYVNPIFAAVGVNLDKLFTASETSEIVFQYVEKERLVKPTDRSVVILDATLCDALYKGAIKKGSTYPTEIHKKDLGLTFMNRMQAHHRVTRGNDSAVRKGALKPIQIMTERRQGNKKVTKLSGLESFLIDPEVLASELQKKFACSTSVTELPGKKGLEVLVQGGVIDDVARYLVEQYGILKRYIEVYDKTRK
ncbi:PREDICTED: eukaryotic translation initiation factor 2D [Ipomoea nil]|uniref:eukaryotic translation initiation factor 2D n=1 Tax=Ipomoea nil TaxID=35883 RepID=UPI000900EFC0|nr:PREDICTED: eukaryotic translation initiation factor 2D [Ipomoea nil]